MASRTSRRRRSASPRQLAVLRAFGWRYSSHRDAWVHRARGGRIGPVFQEVEVVNVQATEEADEALLTLLSAYEHGLSQAVDREGLPLRAVSVRLHDEPTPRIVLVDGRPPRMGTEPEPEVPALRLIDLKAIS